MLSHTRSRRHAALFALISLPTFGCGGRPMDRPAHETLVSIPRPPSQASAHTTSSEPPTSWYFAPNEESAMRRRLDPRARLGGVQIAGSIALGNEERLLVLANGLRVLVKGAAQDAMTRAAGLALPRVAAVTRLEDGTFVALGPEGDYARFRDPLGPVSVSQGSLPDARHIAAGRHSFLAVARSGALLRSTDGGATWIECNLPGPPGMNVGVYMDGLGFGQVLRAPQHLVETRDDGLTWEVARAAQVWQGASAPRDAEDEEDRVAPVVHFLSPESQSDEVPLGRLVAGTKVHSIALRFESMGRPVLVLRTAVLPIETHPGTSEWAGDLEELGGGAGCSDLSRYGRPEISAAARGDVAVVAVRCKKGTLLLRSTDSGGTFGSVAIPAWASHPGRSIAILAFVTADGSVLLSEGDGQAQNHLLRVARNGSLTTVADEAPIGFDGNVDGRLVGIVSATRTPPTFVPAHFLVSDDGGNSFRRVTIPSVPLSGSDPIIPTYSDGAIGHDLDGQPVAFLHGSTLEPGATPKALRAVLADGDRVETSLAPWFDGAWMEGPHGLLTVRRYHGSVTYETSDGGRSFLEVAVPFAVRGCAGDACDFGDALRIGWEHEGTGPLSATALASALGRDDHRARSDVAKPRATAEESPALECTADGAWASFALPSALERLDFPLSALNGRLLGTLSGPHHSVEAMWLVREGGHFRPKTASLLPATFDSSANDRVRTSPYGVIAVRDHAAARGWPSAARRTNHRIDVAWLDGKTLSPHTAGVTAKVEPWGIAQVLENAAVVQAGARLWIMSPDGSSRSVEIPRDCEHDVYSSYGDLLVGRGEEFVGILHSSEAVDDSIPFARVLFKKGEAKVLPRWTLGGRTGEDAPLGARDGTTGLGLLDRRDGGQARLLVTDAASAGADAGEVREIPLAGGLSARPLVCAKGGSSSWRFTTGDSRLRVRVKDGEALDVSNVELGAREGGGACVASAEVDLPRESGAHFRAHAWIDLAHPELSVMIRSAYRDEKDWLEYRGLHCAMVAGRAPTSE